MDIKTWNKIGQIVDSVIDQETYKSILIDHLGEKCKFTGKNKEYISIIDPNLQNTLGFTTDVCCLVKQNMGGIKNKDGKYESGLDTIILTGTNQVTATGFAKTNADNRVGLGATNIMYFTTYGHDEKNYVKAIQEIINYSGLSEMALINLLQANGISEEDLEEITNELDFAFEEEVSNNIVMENGSVEFMRISDDETELLLSKIQSQIDPSLFVYQLYQNDYIDFEEYVKVQDEILDQANKIDEIDIALNPIATIPLGLIDNSVRLKKDDKCGYVLSQMLDFENKEAQNVDYLTICKNSKIDEPCKYGITQILLNSEFSPNEIIRNCTMSNYADTSASGWSLQTNGLSEDERKIFEYAVSFCRTQNPYFLANGFMRDAIIQTAKQLQDEQLKTNMPMAKKMVKSAIYNLNNQPLYVFDRRFYESVAKNGLQNRNVENKVRKLEETLTRNMLYKKSKRKDFSRWLKEKEIAKMTREITRICKRFVEDSKPKLNEVLHDLKKKTKEAIKQTQENLMKI